MRLYVSQQLVGAHVRGVRPAGVWPHVQRVRRGHNQTQLCGMQFRGVVQRPCEGRLRHQRRSVVCVRLQEQVVGQKLLHVSSELRRGELQHVRKGIQHVPVLHCGGA